MIIPSGNRKLVDACGTREIGETMKRFLVFLLFAFIQLAPHQAHSQAENQPRLDQDRDFAADSTRQNRNKLIGTWYRSQVTTGGDLDSEMSILRADGTYLFRFRQIDRNGAVQYYTESGFWGISGNVHFTIAKGYYDDGVFHAYDPSDHANYVAYIVLELSDDRFIYQTVTSGTVYTSERVKDGFEFPDSQAADKSLPPETGVPSPVAAARR